jgi:hypothetical protein
MELRWNFGGIQMDNFQWNKVDIWAIPKSTCLAIDGRFMSGRSCEKPIQTHPQKRFAATRNQLDKIEPNIQLK